MIFNGHINIRVEDMSLDIRPEEHLDQLALTVFGERMAELTLHGGKVCTAYDISMHGSPQMTYTPTSRHNDDAELYAAMRTVYEELKGWRQ